MLARISPLNILSKFPLSSGFIFVSPSSHLPFSHHYLSPALKTIHFPVHFPLSRVRESRSNALNAYTRVKQGMLAHAAAAATDAFSDFRCFQYLGKKGKRCLNQHERLSQRAGGGGLSDAHSPDGVDLLELAKVLSEIDRKIVSPIAANGNGSSHLVAFNDVPLVRH